MLWLIGSKCCRADAKVRTSSPVTNPVLWLYELQLKWITVRVGYQMTIEILDSCKCITYTNGLNERAIAQIQRNTFVLWLKTRQRQKTRRIIENIQWFTVCDLCNSLFMRSERRLLQTTFQNVKTKENVFETSLMFIKKKQKKHGKLHLNKHCTNWSYSLSTHPHTA